MRRAACRSFGRWLDRAGPAQLESRYAPHLSECAHCRRRYEGYLRFRGELAADARTAADELGEPSWDAIFAAARRPAPRRPDRPAAASRTHRLTPLPARAAAAAAIVVLLGLGGVAGYHQYRELQVRAFVRADTTAFVNAIFAEPFFPNGSATGGGAPLAELPSLGGTTPPAQSAAGVEPAAASGSSNRALGVR